jgi:hypothetical protein
VAHVHPDQEAALRRLRAAFGFIEVLEIIDHQPSEDPEAARSRGTTRTRTWRRLPTANRSVRRWLLDALEHDPLVLVRQGPYQLVVGDPAAVVGGGVGLQGPGEDHPVAAAGQRAAPVAPRLAGVMVSEDLGRLVPVTGWVPYRPSPVGV